MKLFVRGFGESPFLIGRKGDSGRRAKRLFQLSSWRVGVIAVRVRLPVFPVASLNSVLYLFSLSCGACGIDRFLLGVELFGSAG